MNKHQTIFHKKLIKHGAIDEVITGAYDLDFATCRVRVAGVKFTRKDPCDHWTRQKQSEYARQRLAEAPFILEFDGEIKSLHHYNYRRLEKFMRSFFTLNGLTEKKSGMIHRFGKAIHEQIFRETLTANEVASYKLHLKQLAARGLPIYNTDYWNNLTQTQTQTQKQTQKQIPAPTLAQVREEVRQENLARYVTHPYVPDYMEDINTTLRCLCWCMFIMCFTILVNTQMIYNEIIEIDHRFTNMTYQMSHWNQMPVVCYD